ncbi:MAG: cysteine synthase family protein [Tissierellia bacterium]|nr:cysteine synthase family protein [Tissierellia bacterium]
MMKEDITYRLDHLSKLIGNTPLVEIRYRYKGKNRRIFAKAEYYNLTGSIKDRMAFHILKKAYELGKIKEGYRILEATSGNTGISFSALGSFLGHRVTIFMPNWMSKERINIIRSFGAEIRLVSPEEGGFLGSIKMTEDIAKEEDRVFLPRQFSNEANVEAHYTTTGPEIWTQLKKLNLAPDAVITGVGTGGTIMGIGRFLKEKNPLIKLYPLEPTSSPTLSTGYKVGAHRIQGISDEFIPPIVNLEELDEVIDVHDGDAIIMAQKMAAELGMGVGISSGANILGAIMVQDRLGDESTVVTVLADDNKKYLSTDLMKNEPVKKDYISSNVELMDLVSYR